MKTKREIITEWSPVGGLGWTLRIPAGTRIETKTAFGATYGLTARPSMVIDSASRIVAERPGSLFKHDATHRYVWVNADDCEP